MSSINWNGNRVMQRVGNDAEELGYVDLDSNSGTYVLWLKDTCGVLDLSGGYIRGDEFESMSDAKNEAASSPSAFIMHYIWLRRATRNRAIEAVDEHWDEISSQLDGDETKATVSARICEFWNQLPSGEIEKWAGRIVTVGGLVNLIKELL